MYRIYCALGLAMLRADFLLEAQLKKLTFESGLMRFIEPWTFNNLDRASSKIQLVQNQFMRNLLLNFFSKNVFWKTLETRSQRFTSEIFIF